MLDTAVITCPFCKAQFEQELTEGSCSSYPECVSCRQIIRENPGECCVICSHSNRICLTQYDRGSCCNE